MWEIPYLPTVKQLELLSRSVSVALPFSIDDYKCYGDFLYKLDLSSVADRWDTIDYNILAPIFKHCMRLEKLNMNGCQKLVEIRFECLFAYNAKLCSSLKSVDFSETFFLVSSVSRILKLLPSVQKLLLNVTTTDDELLVVISQSMPDLEWLEIERCGVSDVGIRALAKGCPKLAYLRTEMCEGIMDTRLVQQVNAGGKQEAVFDIKGYDTFLRVFNDDYDDDDYYYYDDYGCYDGKFYEYNYHKDDPDYYMDLEREFRRCDNDNEY
ncbi:hypothetical protein GGH94_000262 [Coemansia aciculifera]|uniref:RNI-like protein n=1 Tax=Coemansia aciculifera TaxID=417176 RepID=A0A9W8IQZ0_9FUNG|nr:hypothetical protein GGH94_000262 [Coemansia aciculifera]KAJ2877162.1 hypothetical protein GGH93_000191 [Coemansia aciculifera]